MTQIELCKYFIEHCTNDLAREQVKLYLKELQKMSNKFMRKVAKELEYNKPIPPNNRELKEPKNPCQQCQKMIVDRTGIDYKEGANNPLSRNYKLKRL